VFVANRAREGGGAIFFVSNDRTGTMVIRDSTLKRNPNPRFHTPGLPGIYFLGARQVAIISSIVR
jgi:predicted outer membrane repeat protein